MNEELRDKYRDEIMKKTRERMELIGKIQELEKELDEVTKLYYEYSGDYSKIVCPFCGGKGYVEENGEKTICQGCNGKLYVWMQTFKEEEKDGKDN